MSAFGTKRTSQHAQPTARQNPVGDLSYSPMNRVSSVDGAGINHKLTIFILPPKLRI
jgi:hypothetical protein